MPKDDSEEMDAILEKLRQGFIDTAFQKLEDLNAMLNELWEERSGESDILMRFLGEIHSLKGLGGTFQFPTISLVAHHLESYLADTKNLTNEQLTDVQIYLDYFNNILAKGLNPDDEESEKILLTLPQKGMPVSTPITVADIKVVIVMPSKTLRQLVEFYMIDKGCRVLMADSPFEAFRMAVQEKPNLVVSSVEMDDLNGIDLGCALCAMPALRNTKFALLTSSSDAGEIAAGFPEGIEKLNTHTLEDDLEKLLGEISSARS